MKVTWPVSSRVRPQTPEITTWQNVLHHESTKLLLYRNESPSLTQEEHSDFQNQARVHPTGLSSLGTEECVLFFFFVLSVPQITFHPNSALHIYRESKSAAPQNLSSNWYKGKGSAGQTNTRRRLAGLMDMWQPKHNLTYGTWPNAHTCGKVPRHDSTFPIIHSLFQRMLAECLTLHGLRETLISLIVSWGAGSELSHLEKMMEETVLHSPFLTHPNVVWGTFGVTDSWQPSTYTE